MANTPAPISASPDIASQLAKIELAGAGLSQAEPGYANSYGPGSADPGGMLAASLPALGVGGLGLWLLYRRRLQDQKDRDEALLPMKQADVISQLPGAHPKDMLLGAALGGGAGLLYDLAKGQPEGRRFSTTLKRLLTGAGVGAVGANFVGDRARRYITNTKLPFGYAGESLWPRSWQHFYDAAIADRPSFDPAAVAKLKDNFGGNAEVADTALKARYELWRRGMNIHRNNAKTDIWQSNKGNKGPEYLSLNEQHPKYEKMLRHLYLPSQLHPISSLAVQDPDEYRFLAQELAGKRPDAPIRPTSALFADPLRFIRAKNRISTADPQNGWRNEDLFGANQLLGEQQVVAAPGPNKQDPRLYGTVLDRFDVTPDTSDLSRLISAIKNLDVFRPSWWNATADQRSAYYGPTTTNSAWLKSLLSRLMVDRFLTEKHPWVAQKFYFTPQDGGGHALQFQNTQGQPAGPAINADTLSGYLSNLQNQK